jgi:hypothetical protein
MDCLSSRRSVRGSITSTSMPSYRHRRDIGARAFDLRLATIMIGEKAAATTARRSGPL